MLGFMVLNASFNTISVIFVLLEEEITDLSQVHKKNMDGEYPLWADLCM
jgi:hypothetical protein